MFKRLKGRLGQACPYVAGIVQQVSQSDPLALGTVLAVSLPLVIWNALRYQLPMGYAGFYSLMAEQISGGGFRPPVLVSHYGPGGVPFAYPPVGLYLMAVVTRISGVTSLDYARFAGPIFTFLSLVPMYMLSRKVCQSRAGAVVATLVLAASYRSYLFHGEAAGLVRALAFLFCLSGLYLFALTCAAPTIRGVIVTSALLALTVLTHLTYGLFFAVFATALVIGMPRWKPWWIAAFIAFLGLLLVLPWMSWVANRYGVEVFAGAWQSHGTALPIAVLQDPARSLLPRIQDSLRNLLRDPTLTGLTILGLVSSLAAFDLRLPFAFVTTAIVISEGDRFIFVEVGMLAGLAAALVVQGLRAKVDDPQWVSLRVGLWLALLGVLVWRTGFRMITRFEPLISTDTLAMARFVDADVAEDVTFLSVMTSEEAEWLPYLLDRDPSVSPWGAEWKGTYGAQLGLALELATCDESQSLECLNGVLRVLSPQPDLLITRADRVELGDALVAEGHWGEMYRNANYVVWSK